MNDRTRSAVALEVDVAATRATRRRGLLGRASLGATEGLLLSPCKAVHTVGMRFPIDVIFIDRDARVVRIVPALVPWRIAISVRAKAVIELAAGTAAASDIQIGDLLYLAPAPPVRKRTAVVKGEAQRTPETARQGLGTGDSGLANPQSPGPSPAQQRAVPIEEHPPC